MNPAVNAIASRLSLRPPQRTSLEILDRVCDLVRLEKSGDLTAALAAIRVAFPTVEAFEREFPSLCFALATGVGKTRLMGAFVAYLARAHDIRHFFVLAPNLTIYQKLIDDFTPNTRKYVFQGIAEFVVDPPEIITGETYERGRVVRDPTLFGHEHVHVNIFNISKINAELRGERAPRIKRLSEYIGESYFEYLSKLDDLVLLMDESHRYRATAGLRVLNELRPILGLELTATPQVERGSETVPFRNVVYSYPLSSAMADGFVKEPAVATRENFDAANFTESGLERLKLEDGVRIHEATKVELDVYARENARPMVKPFMLVIARDTEHANALVKTIEDPAFFEGRYKGKVITVHSNLRGEERDETVAQLITVEDPANPTEIVVHVNMLKEGWDVTNLYTIVPLRAANSQTLVEQSIGRGLRLPYGKRTGVEAVDRLTIVAHDRFQEIVDYAKDPNSVIRGGLKVIFVKDEASKAVTVQPEVLRRLVTPFPDAVHEEVSLYEATKRLEVAQATLDVIHDEFERLSRSRDLAAPDVQEKIVARVRERLPATQGTLEGIGPKIDVPKVVAETIELRNALSIDIPKIVVQPEGEVVRGYKPFRLDLSSLRLQPVDTEILIQELQRGEQHRLTSGSGVVPEAKQEDYVVRGLMNFDDVCYDDHAALIYELASQVVAHLRTYLKNEDEISNVLQYHQQKIASLVHAQMEANYEERPAGYRAHVTRGFSVLRPVAYVAGAEGEPRDFRVPLDEKQEIRRTIFCGFERCLYPQQKFDSDPERRLAVVLENDRGDVLKWFRPRQEDIRIEYASGDAYEPDFIVEAKSAKYVVEVKAANEMDDPIVIAKAEAAAEWCHHATVHERAGGGKPWSYLLIPHDEVAENKTLKGLAAAHTYTAKGKPRGV